MRIVVRTKFEVGQEVVYGRENAKVTGINVKTFVDRINGAHTAITYDVVCGNYDGEVAERALREKVVDNN